MKVVYVTILDRIYKIRSEAKERDCPIHHIELTGDEMHSLKCDLGFRHMMMRNDDSKIRFAGIELRVNNDDE